MENLMASNKSQDPYIQILGHLLLDVKTSLSGVITSSAYRRTIQKIERRYALEGMGFLTKTLPSLGKRLDQALAENTIMDATALRFEPLRGSKLPKLFGELFQRVFSIDGRVLPEPCVASIKALRQLLFVFYKLELPYAPSTEQSVIDKFIKTCYEIEHYNNLFRKVSDQIDAAGFQSPEVISDLGELWPIVRKARKYLYRLFQAFDAREILPCHGPGAVSTSEQLWEKWHFERINPRIQQMYPFDAYFCASVDALLDTYPSFEGLVEVESMARVILVPKDSRGPRLISCEPLEFQWVQQGLGAAIVEHVESHRLTRWNVHFTNQQPNQFGALLGSKTGRYATLDLKDASDRVTVGLVRLLFPYHICEYLEACRSLGTVLPDGRIKKLNKYAPMGSALCFPVLALTVWAILTAGTTDADARESILVYGDDVIVESAQAETSMKLLESFGLLVNRDKSCYHGFFRESCGMDAYKGIPVTPVRLHEQWSLRPRTSTYLGFLEFSNNLYKLGYYNTSELIARWLCSVYTDIPTADMNISCPSLLCTPSNYHPPRKRRNKSLQRLEYRVLTVRSPSLIHPINGWSMLLRYFTEGRRAQLGVRGDIARRCAELGLDDSYESIEPFSASSYTRRDTSHLVKRWRGCR